MLLKQLLQLLLELKQLLQLELLLEQKLELQLLLEPLELLEFQQACCMLSKRLLTGK